MPQEGEPKVDLERYAWRATGIGIALEGVRILATMPPLSRVSEAQGIEYLGVGVFIVPAWISWGEGRGWLIEDVGRVISSAKSLLGLNR